MSCCEEQDANFITNQNGLYSCDFFKNFGALISTPYIIYLQIHKYKNAKHMKINLNINSVIILRDKTWVLLL